jgi:hypothetical protein
MVKYFAAAEWPEGHEREFEREDDYDVISTRKADIRKFARQAIKDGVTQVDIYFESKDELGKVFGWCGYFSKDNPNGTDPLGKNF